MFSGIALILISLLIFAFIIFVSLRKNIKKNEEVAGGVLIAFVIASFLLYGGAYEIDKSLTQSSIEKVE